MVDFGSEDKSKTSLSSAEEIGYNEDLIIEILLNLSAKSLIRFKAVSKQWMCIISDTNFCIANAKAALKPSTLLILNHFEPCEGPT
ncbi:hypothetical protein HRI_004766100 [Hibiscus trionum]|uniref:F-box domain-containing protein n=1 Tax=Hibiscus trionum TaxID=183268 RepID=A0A9W7JCL6_HIBTR|nr:hypothetical protein HRI_004766100 [Hibiscus trionum]